MNKAKKIVVVEDELHIRNAIEIELKESGFQTEGFGDCQGALNYLENGNIPDLILLDIIMRSSISGLELLAKIKQNEILEQIPVIMISAKTDSDTILEALKLGAVDFLPKPYSNVDLNERVKRALKAADPATNVDRVDDYKKLYSDVMSLSVLLWEIGHAKTKVELADESGFWSVYTDKRGVSSSRNMNRYLQPTSVPDKPNSSAVLSTGLFVLNKMEGCGMNKSILQLSQALEKLEKFLISNRNSQFKQRTQL